ncbi:hypothetical protein ACHQM5_019057 [Ranunculus cassubicifolius]
MSAKLHVFFFFLLFFILGMAEAITMTKPRCQKKCGNVSIPYPFGIGSSCSFDRSIEMRCDTTFNPPKLFFTHSIPYQVVNLSIQPNSDNYYPSVHIKNNVSRICYDGSGAITSSQNSSLSWYNNTPFTLSATNNLTVIGCNMRGVLNGVLRSEISQGFTVGCTTQCDKIENSVERKCPGPGCCQVRVPYDYRTTGPYNIQVEALNVSGIRDDSRCGSAFLSYKDEYKFNASDIQSIKHSTVLLYFRFRNQTCEDACKGVNTRCDGDYYKDEYYCTCKYGYEGNPYLDPGCPTFEGGNECSDAQKQTCKHKCIKIPGYPGYRCAKPFPFKWIILGAGLGLFLLGGGVWMYYKKRKQLLKLSEKLDQLNARLLLIQEISSNAKIFTAKKLQQATNNFHESRILGEGGYGKVYKGILLDQSIVAVKKSKIIEKSQFDEFINEVAILAKIDHRNIVKLLGCSVETEHPLLVYEFVSNGTLTDHIFKKGGMPYSSMSWETRLRIAAEVAGALAYLHSAASVPIIHRDVKPSNILLDENFTAKVADFGVSRFNYLDQTAISTLVKGTLGYLDPEYMLTSQLTEKSDVFSFGVVLAELITGKKSISFERAQGERNLAIYFTASMNEERLLHIVEEGMVNEGNIKQVQEAAAIAQKCLSLKGEERPSMREVASELEALRGFKKHPSSERSSDKHANFTPMPANPYPVSAFNDGASGSSVAEITMTVMVAR